MGSIHRNSYVESWRLLGPDLALRARPDVQLAGQITGVEGYSESIASGFVAAVSAAARAAGKEPLEFPEESMIGALMSNPRLLLCDEPSLGLAPAIVSDMFRVIQTIHQEGTAVMLVEQNVSRALAISSRTYVLENGRVIAEGDSDELANRPEIRKAYLGL